MKKRMLIAAMTCILALGMTLLSGCDNPLDKKTYTPESKTATLSAPVIGVDGTLRVGVNTGNPPLAGQASKIVGLDVDIAAALADEWGLALEIVDVGSNPLTSLQNGTVDIVLGIDQTNTDAAVWKSSSYLPTGIALFSLNSQAALPSNDSKIAAQSTSMSAWSAQNAFPDSEFVGCADLKSALANLSDGTADYVAADAVIGLYAANTSGVSAYIVGLLQPASGYSAGVLSTNTALSAAVENTLSKLSSNGTISVIEKKWLNTKVDLSSTPTVTTTTTDTETDSSSDEQKEDSSKSE